MDTISTFSIAGRDPKTGELGVAVQSKFLAVGAVVPWAKAGVGAIATQALANLSYGELGLKLLEKGYTPAQAIQSLTAADEKREERQVGIVAANGSSAAYTGKGCFEWAGHMTGTNFSCQGNILVSEDTVKALAKTFECGSGSLARKLLNALDKAQDAGGDRRGRQSAALLVVKEKGSYGGYNDRYIDLRVDDDADPIKKLSHLLDLHELYFSEIDPEDRITADSEIIREMQSNLIKLKLYEGQITGIFDEMTMKAYESFCGIENFEERLYGDEYVDRRVMDFLAQKAAKACGGW
jgi:uncharacterized Ntn-hydrolase superfamily protein